MNNSPHLPKVVKGRPSTVTLQSIYEYMESLKKCREEGEAKLYAYIEALEKRREEREAKLHTELEALLDNKFTLFEDKIQTQLDNKIKKLENKLETMENRLHVIENQKPPEQGDTVTLENLKLKDMIKDLEEKVNQNLATNNREGKLDIKHIKEEMNKLIALDHERNKRALNLIIFGLKEEAEEDTLAIVRTELHNRLQIETTCFTEATRLGKLIENKERLIRVKVSSTEKKYDILSKTSSLKGSGIFISEDLIPEDQAELRKEVQKVKEARKEGKWALIRNIKVGIQDMNQKNNNK